MRVRAGDGVFLEAGFSLFSLVGLEYFGSTVYDAA